MGQTGRSLRSFSLNGMSNLNNTSVEKRGAQTSQAIRNHAMF